MHRRIWISLTALGLLASFAASGFASTPEEEDLLKTREAVWRAWFANDQKTLEQLVPPETIAISSGEDGWQNQPEILQSATDFQAKGGKLLRLEFPRTEFRHYGDVVVLYSQYLYETEMNGKRSTKTGRATEVFVRRDGKWTNPGWQTGPDK